MKKFLSLIAVALAFFANSASAQKLTVNNIEMAPGGEGELVIGIDYTEPVWSLEFNIELPAGITADFDKAVKGELMDQANHKIELTGSKLMMYPGDFGDYMFAAASGTVAKIPLKAGADLAEGVLEIKLTEISAANADGDALPIDDMTIEVKIAAEAGPYVEPEGTHKLENGLGNLKPGEYKDIQNWGGCWSGNQIENERDWSKFDYLWIKYKDFSGSINFGIMYNEWIATQNWGEQYKDETVALKDPYGVIGVKINHTDKYVNGNAKENGSYVGDIYSQHIREIFIQGTGAGSVTIEEIWLGSEEDYLKAVEDNKYVDETVYKDIMINGDLAGDDVSCFFSKEWAPSEQIQNSRIVELDEGDAKVKAIAVNSFAKISKDWDSQFWIRMPQKLAAGTKFKISFDYKASAKTSVDTQCHNEAGQYIHYQCVGTLNFTDEWQTLEGEFTVPAECNGSDNPSGYKNDFHSIALNLTKAEDMVYYFKNFKIEIPEDAVTEGDTYTPEAAPYKEAEGTHQLAGNRLGLLKAGDYAPGVWGGQWSGNNIANERDWSDFDYFWIKYSGFTGAINFGIMYSEWLATQSWGEQYKDETVKVEDPEGVIGIKINKTDTYATGNAKENGAYVGDIFAKHIREVFIQATAGDSKITIEEFWIGSEEDYLKAVEEAQTATGIKSFSAAKKVEGIYNLAGQKVDKNYKGIVIVNGKKMMMK